MHMPVYMCVYGEGEKRKEMEKDGERRKTIFFDRDLVLVLGSIDASNAMDWTSLETCQNVCLVLR